MIDIKTAVEVEKERAMFEHPPFRHWSHAAGVIGQALHDINDAAKHKGFSRNRENVLLACAGFISIAAVAQRVVENCFDDVTQEELDIHMQGVNHA